MHGYIGFWKGAAIAHHTVSRSDVLQGIRDVRYGLYCFTFMIVTQNPTSTSMDLCFTCICIDTGKNFMIRVCTSYCVLEERAWKPGYQTCLCYTIHCWGQVTLRRLLLLYTAAGSQLLPYDIIHLAYNINMYSTALSAWLVETSCMMTSDCLLHYSPTFSGPEVVFSECVIKYEVSGKQLEYWLWLWIICHNTLHSVCCSCILLLNITSLGCTWLYPHDIVTCNFTWDCSMLMLYLFNGGREGRR